MPEVKRSEEDILSQAPIVVKFGDVEYKIKPLRMIKAREWRDKLIKEVQSIGTSLQQDTSTSPVFIQGLAFVFLQFPQKMADLVFSYAPNLPREKIENEGTEEQLARAFGQIVQIAFPFVGELQAMMQTLSMSASFPALAKSTKPQ
jgi:hypothetical protein